MSSTIRECSHMSSNCAMFFVITHVFLQHRCWCHCPNSLMDKHGRKVHSLFPNIAPILLEDVFDYTLCLQHNILCHAIDF